LKRDAYGYLALNSETKQILQILAKTDYEKAFELPEILHNNEDSDLANKLAVHFFGQSLLSDAKFHKVYEKFKHIVANKKAVILVYTYFF
jgi:hypothetical protein